MHHRIALMENELSKGKRKENVFVTAEIYSRLVFEKTNIEKKY
mgnify:CR=1 FL=1